jgi:peptidoglycan/xylan/chitin deacetylase (PgdA/CDA1 family)
VLSLPLSWASPAGARSRLSILIFHRVLAQPDALSPDEPDAARFETQMRWVRDWFNVLPLAQAVPRLYAGTLPARALCVTFDDGYADNEAIAAPILARLGLTATFFVSTGFLDGGCMWNDRLIEAVRACKTPELDLADLGLARYPTADDGERQQAVARLLREVRHLAPARRDEVTHAVMAKAGLHAPPELMMRPPQLRSLRAQGMDIGAHTVTHPILASLSAQQARDEIGQSREHIEHHLGEKISLFAYPNGVPHDDYAAEHAQMVQDCGFIAAVSTAWGAASARSQRYQLPRFTPWDKSRLRYGARLLANYTRTEKTAN